MASLCSSVTGWIVGQLDRAYFLQRVISGSNRPLLFSHGWGEEVIGAGGDGSGSGSGSGSSSGDGQIGAAYDAIIAALAAGKPILPPEAALVPQWEPGKPHKGHSQDQDQDRGQGQAEGEAEGKEAPRGRGCCRSRRKRSHGSGSSRTSVVPEPGAQVPSGPQSTDTDTDTDGSVVRVRIREGHCESPMAHILPPGPCRTLRFLYVVDERCRRLPGEPPSDAAAAAAAAATGGAASSSSGAQETSQEEDDSSKPLPATITILTAATGEQGYTDRVVVARRLLSRAAAAGLGPGAVCIVMAPFYAKRKPEGTGQRKHYIQSVAWFQAQSCAIMCEAAALLAWAHSAVNPRAKLCVSGFSWGASMTACAAILVSSLLPPAITRTQLAAVPYVGSCGPEPVVAGVLSGDIDWAALCAAGKGGEALGVRTQAQARERLARMLRETHLRRFVAALLAAPNTTTTTAASGGSAATSGGRLHVLGSAVVVGMAHDHFVPLPFTRELYDMLAPLTTTGTATATAASASSAAAAARYVVLPGGHVAAYMHRPLQQVNAILQALDLLP